MPLEHSIAKAGDRELTRRGAYWIATTGTSRAGIPDRIANYRGHAIAIEYKQPGRHPTPLQHHELHRFQTAGGQAIVARSRQDVRELLDKIDHELDIDLETAPARR